MKKPSERITLSVILIIAFIFRVWGIWYGLPLLPHLDENTIRMTVERMLESGNLNPGYFRYPTLYPYFIYFLIYFFRALVGGFLMSEQYMNAFYLIGRFSTAVISTAIVYLTYGLGKVVFSRRVALLGASVMAFMFLPIYLSHFMTTDMLALFFLLVSLILCSKVASEGRLKDYLLAGLFSGFLIGTKLNVIILIPLVFSHFLPAEKNKKRPFLRLVAAFLMVGLVFILTNPYFILDWKNYVSGAWSQIMLQKGEEVIMMSDRDGIPSWWWYWQYWFYSGIGFTVSSFALLGVLTSVLNVRRNTKKFLLFILFPVFYLVIISLSHHRGDRYSLPLMPFFAIFSGLFLERVMDFFGRIIHHSRARLVAFSFFLLIFLGPSIYKGIAFDYSISQKDTRVLAAEWVAKEYPREQIVFAIGDTINIGHYLQKEGFGNVMNLFPFDTKEIFQYPGEVLLIDSVNYHIAENYENTEEYKEFWENYQLIKKRGELVKEFSQPLFKAEFFSPAFLEHSSTVNAYHNPAVEIYKIPKLDEYATEEVSFEYLAEKMIHNMQLIEKNGKKFLFKEPEKGKLIAGPYKLFPKGDYLLEYFIISPKCYIREATVTLAVAFSGEAREPIESKFSCLSLGEYNKLHLEFQLNKPTRLELILGADKGVSFFVEKAVLRRINYN